MLATLKSLAVPGSLGWLALMLLASALLLSSRGSCRRAGGAVLATGLILYIVLSLPIVACHLIGNLTIRIPPVQGAPVEAIVLLDGDNPDGRIQETVRLYGALQPRWVVVSGDSWLSTTIEREGVPADRILMDATSETTREQAVNVASLLEAHDVSRSALVASAIQMRRALGAFDALGIDVQPFPSALGWRGPCQGSEAWQPARSALYASHEAIYEYLALWYYRWQGWLGPRAEQSQPANELPAITRDSATGPTPRN